MNRKNDHTKKDQGTEVIVSIQDVHKTFDDNVVLSGVDLELYKGENIVVMGRSGSGKSVLIKIIVGLMKPDKGEVKVFGKKVHSLNKEELMELRLRIGFLFQHSALYDSMTVRENVEFPLTRNARDLSQQQIDKAVDEVLDAVGLKESADQFPSELSGGQEKRIAIARTLILKPELILYDEPTAGLDPITSVEINQLIKKVKEKYNTSSLIITHDLACAKQTGDKIVMLVGGKFIKQGDFEEVFESDDERIKGFYDYNFIK